MQKKIFIIDDHELFSRSLEMMINSFEDYRVTFCGQNGQDLVNKLKNKSSQTPDIILLDINMPVMNGYETAEWLNEHHPDLNVLVLSMLDNEEIILKMIKKGIKGYLPKDISPKILRKALDDTINYGFFQSEQVTKALIKAVNKDKLNELELKDKELQFVKLSCSEMTYKEIASIMSLSPKTIDGYRDMLFEKLEVKSRVGLVIYAIRHGLYEI